jgi:hypothetical protein
VSGSGSNPSLPPFFLLLLALRCLDRTRHRHRHAEYAVYTIHSRAELDAKANYTSDSLPYTVPRRSHFMQSLHAVAGRLLCILEPNQPMVVAEPKRGV